jgi:hypothetical protein
MEARLGGAMLAWLALMPLALYGLAAVTHLAARAVGGRGDFYGARLALFWSLLAAAPMWVLAGAVSVVGGLVAQAVALAALGGFAWLWLPALFEAERGGTDALA